MNGQAPKGVSISEMLPVPTQVEREHSERQRRNICVSDMSLEGTAKKAGTKCQSIRRKIARRIVRTLVGFICCITVSMLILPETAVEVLLLLSVVAFGILTVDKLMD